MSPFEVAVLGCIASDTAHLVIFTEFQNNSLCTLRASICMIKLYIGIIILFKLTEESSDELSCLAPNAFCL